jgi:hypothetical protein
MINRTQRDCLADAIHALAAGLITNDEFEESLLRGGILLLADPSCCLDSAIGPISESAWCLYSDHYTYRLVGQHRLSAERRRDVLRWVLFLRSDLEYEWPPFRLINPALVSLSGFLLWLLTFGVLTRRRFARQFADWQIRGKYGVWPFFRHSDFEAVSRQNCPFTALRTGSASG